MRKTILIVDDNDLSRKMLKDFFEIYYPDVLVIGAENGAEAWTIICSGVLTYDLLMSDADMPEMGGVELISKVSAAFPTVHTVLMSGRPEPEVHCARNFLNKPFDADALTAAIKEVMEK